MDRETEIKEIEKAMSFFPETFGLGAFPGDIFRISRHSSYVTEGKVMLYTEILKEGKWLSFAKGTANELRREITEA